MIVWDTVQAFWHDFFQIVPSWAVALWALGMWLLWRRHVRRMARDRMGDKMGDSDRA